MKQHRYKNWFCTILVLLVSACGNPNLEDDVSNSGANSGSTSSTSTSTTNGYLIRLSLVKALDSQATSTISSSSPGKLIAAITNDKGQPASEVLVSFTSDFALFSPASATALSDANGQATILLLPGDAAGAGTVSASITIKEEISTKLNFNVASAESASSNKLSVSLGDENGIETTSIRADLPGVLTATLTDKNGAGIGGVVVKAQGSLATFRPENGTVVTDSNGVATIQLFAGEQTGADTLALTATSTGEILTSSFVYQIKPPALQFGNSSAGSFNNETLGISSTSIAASATTSITVDILDANGNAFKTPIAVNFTSNCVAAGTSVIDEKVITVNGQAIATYESKGCQGDDLVTATARYSGTDFTATGTVTVASDSAGFIEFISASPEIIAISGTGGVGLSETSIVTFRVRGKLGNVLPNQLIDFTLNTYIGGLSVTPSSKTTNADGEVTTTVRSGTIASAVRITATVNNTNVSAQSDQLITSTGVPDQNSTSLSFSTHNPEALNYDGEEVIVTARLADRFNNPVPNGTAVYFTTEGGAIQPGCTTSNGSCSVTWTSQEPRPVDHRVTIMAVAIGDESFFDEDGNGRYSDNDGEPFLDLGNGFFDEPFTDTNANNIFDEPFVDSNANNTYDFGESFVDYNNNGRYDGAGNNPAGETTFTNANNSNSAYEGSGVIANGDTFTEVVVNGNFDAPGFIDLPEAYLDINENGLRDNGEPYLDFNFNGQYDNRDGQYNGVLCSHSSICSSVRSLHVRTAKVLIMASSNAYIVVQDATTGDIYASNHPSVASTANLDVSGGTSKQLQITVMDQAGQVMPETTGISIGSDIGEMAGQLDYVVGSSSVAGGHALTATISDDDAATSGSGLITIEVTTPKQHITTLNIRVTL